MKDIYQHPTISRPRGGVRRLPRRLSRHPWRGRSREVLADVLARRAGAGRQQLLRRPGRGLDGDGPVLRAGAQAGRPAVGVDEGHLPAPHDRQPGRGARPTPRPPRSRRSVPARAEVTRRPTEVSRRPASTVEYVLCGALQLLSSSPTPTSTALIVGPGLRVGRRRLGGGRHLPAVGRVRRRGLPRPVPAADPGEVGAHRPVEAQRDPHLEPGVLPVLVGQDAGPVQPAGAVRRLAAVLALPAGAGREGRAGRR